MKTQIQNKIYPKQIVTLFSLVVLGIFSSACCLKEILKSPEQSTSKPDDGPSKKREMYQHSNPTDAIKKDGDAPLVPQKPVKVLVDNRSEIPNRISLGRLLNALNNSNLFTEDRKSRIKDVIIALGRQGIEDLQCLEDVGEGDPCICILRYISNQIDNEQQVLEAAQREREEEEQLIIDPERFQQFLEGFFERFQQEEAERRRPWAEVKRPGIKKRVEKEIEQAEAQKAPTPKELQGTCPICFDDEEPGIRPLKCRHYFHPGCITESLVKDLIENRDPGCPCCRASLSHLIPSN